MKPPLKTYLSFWDVELGNLPTGVFRNRVVSIAEARSMLSAARTSGTLVCVSRADLGAPYETRARDRHEELCKLLREHADIEVHMQDFFGEHCANPSCFAEVTSQGRLLVVDCSYVWHSAAKHSGQVLSSGHEPERSLKALLNMQLAAETLRFHVFEHISDS